MPVIPVLRIWEFKASLSYVARHLPNPRDLGFKLLMWKVLCSSLRITTNHACIRSNHLLDLYHAALVFQKSIVSSITINWMFHKICALGAGDVLSEKVLLSILETLVSVLSRKKQKQKTKLFHNLYLTCVWLCLLEKNVPFRFQNKFSSSLKTKVASWILVGTVFLLCNTQANMKLMLCIVAHACNISTRGQGV